VAPWLSSGALPRLRELDLAGNGAIAAWCAPDGCAPPWPAALERLDVRGTALAGAGAPPAALLAGLPRLRRLELDDDGGDAMAAAAAA